jgi:hypothetical protein
MSICRKMDGTGHHHIKQNKPDSKRQASHFIFNAESRPKKILNNMNLKGDCFGGGW